MASASLWGCELKWWFSGIKQLWRKSASLWGCELKFWLGSQQAFLGLVSLFMRLWVEMRKVKEILEKGRGQPLYEAVSWNTFRYYRAKWFYFVSLFMRLWVEIACSNFIIVLLLSASLWGCELKYRYNTRQSESRRQPLYEAVSWNNTDVVPVHSLVVSLFMRLWVEILKTDLTISGILSASLWGCELKW